MKLRTQIRLLLLAAPLLPVVAVAAPLAPMTVGWSVNTGDITLTGGDAVGCPAATCSVLFRDKGFMVLNITDPSSGATYQRQILTDPTATHAGGDVNARANMGFYDDTTVKIGSGTSSIAGGILHHSALNPGAQGGATVSQQVDLNMLSGMSDGFTNSGTPVFNRNSSVHVFSAMTSVEPQAGITVRSDMEVFSNRTAASNFAESSEVSRKVMALGDFLESPTAPFGRDNRVNSHVKIERVFTGADQASLVEQARKLEVAQTTDLGPGNNKQAFAYAENSNTVATTTPWLQGWGGLTGKIASLAIGQVTDLGTQAGGATGFMHVFQGGYESSGPAGSAGQLGRWTQINAPTGANGTAPIVIATGFPAGQVNAWDTANFGTKPFWMP